MEISPIFQVALTSDGWASRTTQSYITVTSTHINEYRDGDVWNDNGCVSDDDKVDNNSGQIKMMIKEKAITMTRLLEVTILTLILT